VEERGVFLLRGRLYRRRELLLWCSIRPAFPFVRAEVSFFFQRLCESRCLSGRARLSERFKCSSRLRRRSFCESNIHGVLIQFVVVSRTPPLILEAGIGLPQVVRDRNPPSF